MSVEAATYAVVTPARNEAETLAQVACSLTSQTVLPNAWVIVDDGSTDGTAAVAHALAASHSWVQVLSLQAAGPQARGGPVVRAFMAGIRALGVLPDVVVKIDADLSFGADYFERLLQEFAKEPTLGIASGVCHELVDGAWTPSFGTRSHVWGAARAYRRACLEEALPLEERQGWDEVDALKARLEGWSTRVINDLAFRHHRTLGERDGRRGVWRAQGETAYFMGYRPSYLLARTAYRLRREPHAILLLWGFAAAALRKQPRLSDKRVRSYLRDLQRLRSLPLRLRETRGHV